MGLGETANKPNASTLCRQSDATVRNAWQANRTAPSTDL